MGQPSYDTVALGLRPKVSIFPWRPSKPIRWAPRDSGRPYRPLFADRYPFRIGAHAVFFEGLYGQPVTFCSNLPL